MAHLELTLKERRVIARMYDENRPVIEIAQALSRHRSTIYRELQRPGKRASWKTSTNVQGAICPAIRQWRQSQIVP